MESFTTVAVIGKSFLEKEKKYQLAVITVNHNIRKEGASDALFVADQCKKLNVSCTIESIAV